MLSTLPIWQMWLASCHSLLFHRFLVWTASVSGIWPVLLSLVVGGWLQSRLPAIWLCFGLLAWSFMSLTWLIRRRQYYKRLVCSPMSTKIAFIVSGEHTGPQTCCLHSASQSPGLPHSFLFGHIPALASVKSRLPTDVHIQVAVSILADKYDIRKRGVFYLEWVYATVQ